MRRNTAKSTQAVGLEEAHDFFPVDSVIETLQEHGGQTFCGVSVDSLAIGTIPSGSEQPISFYRSGKSDEHVLVKLEDGVAYHLTPRWGSGSQIEDDKTPMYGAYDAGIHASTWRYPYRIFAEESITAAKRMGRSVDTFVIGDRACGAFAFGRALREVEKYGPAVTQTSIGLLLASELNRRDADWVPASGSGREEFEAVQNELTATFIEDALLPLVLARTGLLGSQWSLHGNAIAARTAALSLPSHNELKDSLLDKIYELSHGNDLLAERLTLLGRDAVEPGNYRPYVSAAIGNVLAHQLGIAPET